MVETVRCALTESGECDRMYGPEWVYYGQCGVQSDHVPFDQYPGCINAWVALNAKWRQWFRNQVSQYVPDGDKRVEMRGQDGTLLYYVEEGYLYQAEIELPVCGWCGSSASVEAHICEMCGAAEEEWYQQLPDCGEVG